MRTLLYRHREQLRQGARDLTTDAGRRSAWWYIFIYDHGMLRLFWNNMSHVVPGVYRSNQPSPKRIQKYAAMGIKTIVNLRGPSGMPPFEFEKEACDAYGITLLSVPGLSARAAPPRHVLQDVLQTISTAQHPLMFHCKSGADRTSLAAALYLLSVTGASVSTARKQFGLRYIHFKWTEAGVLDYILDQYEIAQSESGISFQEWLDTVYDGAQIQSEFNSKTGR